MVVLRAFFFITWRINYVIDRLPKEEIAYYDTPDELLAESDIIETDVRVLGWGKKFRIRGLTFGQMARINRHATIREANKELGTEVGDIDNELWTYWTIV